MIEDMVYRITELGVFSYKPEHRGEAENYLNDLVNKQVMLPCGGDEPALEMASNIYYLQPSNCGGGGGGMPPPPPSYDDGCYSTDVTNPSICYGNSSNIFGTTETCEYRTDTHRRLKTKFWNQDFILYASYAYSGLLSKLSLRPYLGVAVSFNNYVGYSGGGGGYEIYLEERKNAYFEGGLGLAYAFSRRLELVFIYSLMKGTNHMVRREIEYEGEFGETVQAQILSDGSARHWLFRLQYNF